MNKKLKKLVVLAFSSIFIIGILSGCGSTKSGDSNNDKSKGTVKLGYVNWAEGVALTNLASAILQDKMGYKVDMKQGEIGMVFTSLARGDMDVYLDGWLPVTHKVYMDKYKGKLENLGTSFENARIGLVVPSYMNINSIEELNDVKDELDGKIVGVDAGAGMMKVTNKAIKEYNLDYKLLEGSEATMTAMLKKAEDKKEPIVVTGWKPHWKFATWDLKFLDDPKGVFGKAENIYTITRTGFEKDMPEVAQFLKNLKMNDKQLGSLMADIKNNSNKEPIDVAREWMKNNEELVNSWIPKSE
ncbi:glycine/betaine ABC transporter [Clostridium tyrobutyricum]|jgi:glycine betaine/proline transport system substrate-binding protein|uniref:Glycine betaine ABC transport system, glycine betaine-binding protein OpuAC n=1 Tax=Clostridium tyrobutyricum DIVETGP TaxID=1408889 RepID=W6NAZ0_CLOTY|nr:glycine betaine ABC transporter substrate-binding protein [Clostridium tyrobutyricum]AND84615.1 glycine betaine-binding protein OpuAC [Clostridium tyrobutyricum]ANP69221.1 glycine/betaine ABC transporter [Clostridium tyrobutyricum]MBV4426528.1 glycine betaine ABC transporter substrate-binding protein [Clostridium tyrobutyricum]MBV4430163.1 glycine betaine ABC transporter substrate-binding protein [Clostridium tyrobutyricum]MBV4433388.1 glycine betaine ABC transporter substrate-binding prote